MLLVYIFLAIATVSFAIGCLFSPGGLFQIFRISYIIASLTAVGYLIVPQVILVLLALIFGAMAAGFRISLDFALEYQNQDSETSAAVDDWINLFVFSRIAEIGRQKRASFKYLSQSDKIKYFHSLREAKLILRKFEQDLEESVDFQKLFNQIVGEVEYFESFVSDLGKDQSGDKEKSNRALCDISDIPPYQSAGEKSDFSKLVNGGVSPDKDGKCPPGYPVKLIYYPNKTSDGYDGIFYEKHYQGYTAKYKEMKNTRHCFCSSQEAEAQENFVFRPPIPYLKSIKKDKDYPSRN